MMPLLRPFAPAAAATSLGGIENVDSIILIYDLDRDETFFRLENHWLPLIERCYNGGVSDKKKVWRGTDDEGRCFLFGRSAHDDLRQQRVLRCMFLVLAPPPFPPTTTPL